MRRSDKPIPLAGEHRHVEVGEPPTPTEFPEGEPVPVLFRQRILNGDGGVAYIVYTGPAIEHYAPIRVTPGDKITLHIDVGP